MKHLLAGLLASVVIVSIATPAMATRTVTSRVGTVHTQTTVNDRDAEFYRIDTSNDNAINFREFQRSAQLENEYEMFNMNDQDNDELLSLNEFRVFSKFGPANSSVGPAQMNYNYNKSAVTR